MTAKEKAKLKEQLKAELLEELQQKRTYPTPYSVAHSDCEMYFSSIKLANQHFGARMLCEDAARQAFKERHGVRGCIRPSTYIKTEADAEEYFSLYIAFLSVYQKYMSSSETSRKEKENERHEGF